MVIINKGRVVAVDTPENLTARLRARKRCTCRWTRGGADAADALATVAGVTKVTASPLAGAITGYEVESEAGHDVRRDAGRRPS